MNATRSQLGSAHHILSSHHKRTYINPVRRLHLTRRPWRNVLHPTGFPPLSWRITDPANPSDILALIDGQSDSQSETSRELVRAVACAVAVSVLTVKTKWHHRGLNSSLCHPRARLHWHKIGTGGILIFHFRLQVEIKNRGQTDKNPICRRLHISIYYFCLCIFFWQCCRSRFSVYKHVA